MTPSLRFKEKDLAHYAARYDYGLDDGAVAGLIPNVRQKQFLSKSDLRVVAAWKSPRSAGHVENNQASYVKEVTSIALAGSSERLRIETLTLLDGRRGRPRQLSCIFFIGVVIQSSIIEHSGQ